MDSPSVDAYVTDAAVFVTAHVSTEIGCAAAEPMERVDRTEPPEIIGEAVLRCLAAFRVIDGVVDDPLTPLLGFLGAKSWRAFARSAVNVAIEQHGNGLELSAAKADARGAYLDFGEPRTCPRDPAAVGAALLQVANTAS